MLKIFIKIILFLVLLIIAAMISMPYLFKDEIIDFIKTEVNENIDAKMDFESLDISLFKSFPDLFLSINELEITGIDTFDGIKLIDISSLEVSVDIMSVIKDNQPTRVNNFELKSPYFNLITLNNGESNYDISKPNNNKNSKTSKTTLFQINLQKYAITNGHVEFHDQQSNMDLTFVDINHYGKGDFTQSIFELDTKTEIEKMTFIHDGVQYLKEVKINYIAGINMNIDEMKFTLQNNDLAINALNIGGSGWLKMNEESFDMDLKFHAPSNDFKDVLSLIPGAYIQGYEAVKANGEFIFSSSIQGSYNEKLEQLPSFEINVSINDANVKYPDLPMSISSINTDLKINSPSSDVDDIKLDISKFSFKLNDNAFAGNLHLTHPISDPKIKSQLKGTINFSDLANAFPFDGITSLTGILDTDIKLKARLSDMEKEDYDNINAEGYFNLTNFSFEQHGRPNIDISTLKSNFTPKSIIIEDINAKFGESDLQLKGTLINYLAYFSPEKTMIGDITMKSELINLNEWMTDTDTSITTSLSPTNENSAEIFDRFNFKFEGNIKELHYEDYTLNNSIAHGQLSSNKFLINNFQTQIGRSDIKINGTINHLFEYLFSDGTLTGKLYLKSKMLDVNELMGADIDTNSDTSSVEETAFIIPKKINLDISTEATQVLYTNIEMRNLTGNITIENQKASIDKLESNTLGGKIIIDGSYDTKDIKLPLFNLNYKFQKIDFKQAFNTFNTFSKIAPIGKYLTGSFDSDMQMDGKIGKDMMPDLMSINADGFLQTFNSFLSGFLPMQTLAQKLNVNELKDMAIQDVKTRFEFKNGRIEVREFPYKWKNIDMKIGGSHGLNQSMDYVIKMKIPRELMNNKSLNNTADRGMGILSDQAAKLGLNINDVEFINVAANITGSITDPKVKISLIGTDGTSLNVVEKVKEEVDEIIEKAKDSVKTVVKEKIEDTKKELKEKADKEIESLMKKANELADKTRDEGYKLAEDARVLGYEQADQLVKKAGNNFVKKLAAKETAKVMRKETDKKVGQMKATTDKKVNQILIQAETEVDKIRKKYE